MRKSRALSLVQKQFAQVRRVVDATRNVSIHVSKQDNAKGRRKNPEHCALAQACVRQKIADGAIVGVGVSYLVKGDTAVRYHTSVAVGREITSFDRHHDFAAGEDYLLSAVPPSGRLGQTHERRGKNSGKHGAYRRRVHRTAFIRKIT